MFLIGLLLKIVMTASRRIVPSLSTVMPGFMPGIHVFAAFKTSKTWMAGTSPAMTLRVNPAMTLRVSPAMTSRFNATGQAPAP